MLRARVLATAAAVVLFASPTPAQKPVQVPLGGWYASWGYNTDSYAPVDLHIIQPTYDNDITYHGLTSHDYRGWNLFRHAPTVPEYSIRIGKFVGTQHRYAVELSFEHARFMVNQGQSARVTGVVHQDSVDTTVVISKQLLTFIMNNGANFLLLNGVRRFALHGQPGTTGSISFLGKAGLGVVLPHADNTVFGVRNHRGYQFGGLDAGLEAAVRVHMFRAMYAELGEKGVFGRYRGIRVNEGTADLNVFGRITMLTIGANFGHK